MLCKTPLAMLPIWRTMIGDVSMCSKRDRWKVEPATAASSRNSKPFATANTTVVQSCCRKESQFCCQNKVQKLNDKCRRGFYFVDAKKAFVYGRRNRREEEKKVSHSSGEVSLISLRHTVINLWQHGMHTADFQFASGSSKKIIQWMQSTHPAHKKFVCAKSFFYRALARHEKAHEQPNMEPHRDRRGENRKSQNVRIPVPFNCVMS